MRKKAPLDRAAQKPNQLLANMHRWKFSVLAAAAVACSGFYASDASALALGRITVQSALGEPLRAEIDLPQITPAEADSLRVSPASPEAFRALGMEYSPVITRVQVQLQRRPDGRTVLHVSSDRPINEPFVDLVLDANWNAGRLSRSYTMLFTPPLENYPSGDDLTDAIRLNQELEQLIRRAPTQYMWFHRRFKSRPKGEQSPYREKNKKKRPR